MVRLTVQQDKFVARLQLHTKKVLRASFIFFSLGIITLVFKSLNNTTKYNQFDPKYFKLSEKEFFPLSVNCDLAQEGFVSFDGYAVTHSKITSGEIDLKKQKELVRSQLKYFDGYVDHSGFDKFRIVPHSVKNFEIKKVTQVKYPAKIYLDSVPLDENYYPKRIQNKWYNSGDEAIKISYTAKLKVTRCLNTKTSQDGNFDIILPVDPYLAYWYVPKEKRVEIKLSSKYNMISTPCASPIMAELIFPNMYWNVWKPRAKRKDFDCAKLLKEGEHIITAKAKFTPIEVKPQPLEFSHLKNKGKIKVSLINGLVFPIDTKENLERARILLANINSINKIQQKDLKEQDIGTLATFTILNLFKELTNDLSWLVEDRQDHFIFKGVGRLKYSNKDFEISIYLGPSVEYQKGRKHWSFLANALEESDFIFYSGHSGMGTAFSLENLKKNIDDFSFIETPKNQFIAILSCSSISYFGDDFIKARRKESKRTDFLLTGFDNHAYRVTPAMIQYVDLELAGKRYDLKSILEYHLGKDEDVHLTRNGI